MPEDDLPPSRNYSVEDRDAADIGLFSDPGAAPTGSLPSDYGQAAAYARSMAVDSAVNRWIPRGPRNVGGRIRAIVQDPLTPRRFFAGSAFGGLWKTENAGETWVSVDVSRAPGGGGGHVEAALPVGALDLCHRKPQHLYVGTGEPVANKPDGAGLFYSDDGGAHFTALLAPGAAHFAQRYEKILVDPWEERRCWAAAPTGLFRRLPGSGSFVRDDITTGTTPPLDFEDVTDIAIDFGDRNLAVRPAAHRYTVYVGLRARRKSETPGDPNFEALHAGGVYRATFNPHTDAYEGGWSQLTAPDFPFPVMPAGFHLDNTDADHISGLAWKLQLTQRIKLSICERQPRTIYMVAGLGDQSFTAVFRSDDRGDTWRRTAPRPGDRNKQSFHCLFVAAHPDDPDICLTGSLDVWRTVNGGASWVKVLDWTNFRRGDRAEHADQHQLLYDRRDPRKVWLANDHGISESPNLGVDWRTRSFGIQATQLYDLTTHPTYPWMMAGGFQDNGSWLCYGGTSWLQCGIADGGAVAFQPGETDVFLTTTQGSVGRTQVTLQDHPSLRPEGFGDFSEDLGGRRLWHAKLGTRLPDRPVTGPSDAPLYPMAVAEYRELISDFNNRNNSLFGHKIAGHPVQPDHFIAGEMTDAWVTDGGTAGGDRPSLTWRKIAAGPKGDPVSFTGETSAIAYAPTLPATAPSPNSDAVWWIGTSDGKVFMTRDGGANWLDVTARILAGVHPGGVPAGARLPQINDIAVHPFNPDIVVVALNWSVSNLLISGNARVTNAAGRANSNWRLISHTAAGTFKLPQARITRVVIDADRALGTGVRDSLTLYVATLVGVFVSRNARARGLSKPQWRSFNTDLPLVLVRDLEYVESHNPDGTPRRRVLRAGTYGRGVYECDLDPAGVPAARLMIRATAIEDSYDYIPSETVDYDPRLNVPGQPPVPLDPTRAIDIRIDPPPYEVFGDTLDAVEFDEDLRSGTLVLGDRNFIYVQVHNRGHATLNDVDVHLYFADAPGTPPVAPDLNPTFWAGFPGPQPAAARWQLAGTDRQSDLHAGQPKVFRIEWIPPLGLGGHVALMAVATHADDTLVGLAPAAQPVTAISPLVASERRVALYVTPTRRRLPDVYVRDAVDDTGAPGAVAWGGRGADIIVTAAAVPDPATAFADLTDMRTDDRVRAGQDNHIHVRAFNRAPVAQSIEVDLFAVPQATLTDPASWVQIGATLTIADVPPGGWGITPGLVWPAADITDPAPGVTTKAYLLVALIGTGDDPRPDPAAISSLADFWAFFRSDAGANNASFRAVPFLPAGA